MGGSSIWSAVAGSVVMEVLMIMVVRGWRGWQLVCWKAISDYLVREGFYEKMIIELT